MLLAIDAGNTNIVFALYEGDRLLANWRTVSDTRRTADDLAVWLLQLMQLHESHQSPSVSTGVTSRDEKSTKAEPTVKLEPRLVSGAIIATVVPELLFPLTRLCKDYFHIEPMVIGEPFGKKKQPLELPIRALIDHPEELGADRLVNSFAAHLRYRVPLLIVDFGTATTFDYIDKQGNYCGGVIAPGINLSLEALYSAAAKLPRVAIKQTERVLGTATVGAMQSGIFWGYVGLIEGLISRICLEVNQKLPIVATGGLAPMFAKATHFDHIDNDLTLYGLLEVYKLNEKNRSI